jgi:6,7-dimethyl-8-ribityllumazine synthase
LNLTIVASSWHSALIEKLIVGAQQAIRASAGLDANILRVPGAFELPLGAARAIELGADAVIAIGVVVRGETPHFEFVAAAATDGLLRVQLDSGIPVGYGLLTVDDMLQAEARSQDWPAGDNKGAEAALAAISMVRLGFQHGNNS